MSVSQEWGSEGANSNQSGAWIVMSDQSENRWVRRSWDAEPILDDPDEGENYLGAENNIRDDTNFCEVDHQ